MKETVGDNRGAIERKMMKRKTMEGKTMGRAMERKKLTDETLKMTTVGEKDAKKHQCGTSYIMYDKHDNECDCCDNDGGTYVADARFGFDIDNNLRNDGLGGVPASLFVLDNFYFFF